MASAHGHARIMFPMVSGIEEVRQIKEIVKEVQAELKTAGTPFDAQLPLGIMIELPAAVQIAGILAKEVDFFSIGTNDLIQYTLAADRNNAKVKKYYDAFHPAVLHSIHQVAKAAEAAGIGVSLCGEMATDPINLVVLLGLGIHNFSVPSPYIPFIKQFLKAFDMQRVENLTDEILSLDSADAIRRRLMDITIDLKRQ